MKWHDVTKELPKTFNTFDTFWTSDPVLILTGDLNIFMAHYQHSTSKGFTAWESIGGVRLDNDITHWCYLKNITLPKKENNGKKKYKKRILMKLQYDNYKKSDVQDQLHLEVNAVMQLRSLTIKELGAEVGIEPSVLSKWLRCENNMRFNNVCKLANWVEKDK